MMDKKIKYMVQLIVFVVRERAVCSKNSALLLLNEFQNNLLLLLYWHAFPRVKKNTESCLIIAEFQFAGFTRAKFNSQINEF